MCTCVHLQAVECRRANSAAQCSNALERKQAALDHTNRDQTPGNSTYQKMQPNKVYSIFFFLIFSIQKHKKKKKNCRNKITSRKIKLI